MADWLGDLWFSVRWYVKYQVWIVPTRRWEGRQNERWPWPLPYVKRK